MKPDPHRAAADDLVADWMKGCSEPVCTITDELRLRAMIATAFAELTPTTPSTTT